jgi:hypothetical protein
MSAKRTLDVRTAAIGFGIILAIGFSLWLVLSQLAQPANLNRRMADLSGQISETERLRGLETGPLDHPLGAVCHQPTPLAVAALKQRLQGALTANGFSTASLVVVPGVGDEATGLSPITFTLSTSGRYDAAVMLIAGLAKTQPEIFVDQADLQSQTSSVSLKLSGRLFCLTSAQL